MEAADPRVPAEEPQGPTFEASLAQLQEIVRDLENGSIGLEESLRRFEQGVALLRGCYRILEHVEQKIEILTGLDAQGNPVLADFDATATAAAVPPQDRRPRKRANGDPRHEEAEETPPGTRLF